MVKMMIYKNYKILQPNTIKNINKIKNLNKNLKIFPSLFNILKTKIDLNQYVGFVKKILILMENKEIRNQHVKDVSSIVLKNYIKTKIL